MSFVHISYSDICDLIAQVKKINFNDKKVHEACNFVFVNENLYNGCYGGIFHREKIKDFESRKMPFIFDTITSNLCLIWWECLCDIKGDMSLCKENFRLVTKEMFMKMKRKPIFNKIKSSYVR